MATHSLSDARLMLHVYLDRESQHRLMSCMRMKTCMKMVVVLDLGQQILMLTELLFLWDGHPVLTADVPRSSAGTVFYEHASHGMLW
jgi:hypothetical protein